MPDGLSPGRWVDSNLPLALLIDDRQPVVHAYVSEEDLGRVSVQGQGQFYPDQPDAATFKITIAEIDRASISVFDDPYNASLYGGTVAVIPKEGAQELVLHESLFRVRLALDNPVSINHPTPGVVRLSAESQSLIERFWLLLSAVLVRESGF